MAAASHKEALSLGEAYVVNNVEQDGQNIQQYYSRLFENETAVSHFLNRSKPF